MHHFARVRKVVTLVLALLVVCGRAAGAQELTSQPGVLATAQSVGAPPAAGLAAALVPSWLPPPSGSAGDPTVPALEPQVSPKKTRPAVLLGLYASFASLQALDAHSTTRALDRGAVEANPLMRRIAGNAVGMLAVKAAGTAGVVYAGERLWKRNKAAAVLFMAAANSAMVMVVRHNYRAVQ